MRHATVRLTLAGDIPDGTNVGDELDISGRITIHSVVSELIDVSTHSETMYAPGVRDFDAYANRVKFEAVDGN